jgi:hypothetical protein
MAQGEPDAKVSSRARLVTLAAMTISAGAAAGSAGPRSRLNNEMCDGSHMLDGNAR